MGRVALAFAYDGTRFDSFARQPGRRTVEGELLAAMRAAGIVTDPRRAGFIVASRTDARVSAAENVCAFDTPNAPGAVAAALRTPDGLWPLGALPVEHGFNPRHARSRRYRYFLRRDPGLDVASVRSTMRLFVGHHDFRNFSRTEPGRDPVRMVRRVGVKSVGGFVEVSVEAPTFLWQQVRRMVAAAHAVGLGRRAVSQVRGALVRPGRRQDLGVAPPDGLLLERVDVGIGFPRPPRRVRQALANAGVHGRVLGRLAACARI